MRLQAITVCVNYGDFLAHTLPCNRRQFDHLIVVTDSKDANTISVCAREKVDCLPMDLCAPAEGKDAKQSGEGVFSKSKAINAALEKIMRSPERHRDEWICILDADIVLPAIFRAYITKMGSYGQLDRGCIYGIDRLMCRSYDAWQGYRGRWQHPDQHFVTTEDFPIGKRFAYFDRDGWSPMGYFQMWNPSGTGIVRYPHNDAMSLCDLQFAQQWPRAKRILIPEILAVHLESEPAIFGANWMGRKTARFGPSQQAVSA